MNYPDMNNFDIAQRNLVDGQLAAEHKDFFSKNRTQLIQVPLETTILLDACAGLVAKLREQKELYHNLCSALLTDELKYSQAQQVLEEILDFILPQNLKLKLQRELGSVTPFVLRRVERGQTRWQGYSSLGVLLHVVPNNSPGLSVLAAIEGLLSGNVNIVKLGRKETSFAARFFYELTKVDSRLQSYIYVLALSSRESESLKMLYAKIDACSAWGSEESLRAIARDLPKHVRFIEWGHKISFSFVANAILEKTLEDTPENKADGQKNSTLENERSQSLVKSWIPALAQEIVSSQQLACSSPQVLYVETTDREKLLAVGRLVFLELQKCAKEQRESGITNAILSSAETAEITMVEEQVRLGSYLDESVLISDRDVRVLVEFNSSLRASPLFGSLWIKPLIRTQIPEILLPMKPYLQTLGLACTEGEYEELLQIFFAVGVLRSRPFGKMSASYLGEPHDGEMALQRFCRRVSCETTGDLLRVSALNFKALNLYLNKSRVQGLGSYPKQRAELSQIANSSFSRSESMSRFSGLPLPRIMTKADFIDQESEVFDADLYFQSGGSSGTPKISTFTYADYQIQMQAAADGLLAAGLEPEKDLCANLFFAGSLYGGFVSFWSILENLQAKQLPIAAILDFKAVAEILVSRRANVVLGMPSYLMQVFRQNEELFRKECLIKKVFFGGEAIAPSQIEYLKSFGVELIRSASYGSVDAGPLGYQCLNCSGQVYHLHRGLHDFEIVNTDLDEPVGFGQVGRLLVSSRYRDGVAIKRYEIGDLVREVSGLCGCGSNDPRVELMGRTGDIVRIGASFLNYAEVQKSLLEALSSRASGQSSGQSSAACEMQWHLYSSAPQAETSLKEVLEIWINTDESDLDQLRQNLLAKDIALKLSVEDEALLDLRLKRVPMTEFTKTSVGKTRHIVDHRVREI